MRDDSDSDGGGGRGFRGKTAVSSLVDTFCDFLHSATVYQALTLTGVMTAKTTAAGRVPSGLPVGTTRSVPSLNLLAASMAVQHINEESAAGRGKKCLLLLEDFPRPRSNDGSSFVRDYDPDVIALRTSFKSFLAHGVYPAVTQAVPRAPPQDAQGTPPTHQPHP